MLLSRTPSKIYIKERRNQTFRLLLFYLYATFKCLTDKRLKQKFLQILRQHSFTYSNIFYLPFLHSVLKKNSKSMSECTHLLYSPERRSLKEKMYSTSTSLKIIQRRVPKLHKRNKTRKDKTKRNRTTKTKTKKKKEEKGRKLSFLYWYILIFMESKAYSSNLTIYASSIYVMIFSCITLSMLSNWH